MTQAIFHYWGKAKLLMDGGAAHHLLPYHSLDVAAVAAAWWNASPTVERLFCTLCAGQESHVVRAWVLFFVAMHDLGKFDIRFQVQSSQSVLSCRADMTEDLLSRVGGTQEYNRRPFNHGPRGAFWFFSEYQDWFGIVDSRYKCARAWQPWVAAVTGHHGVIPDGIASEQHLTAPVDRSLLEYDRQARRDWILVLEQLFLQPVGLDLRALPPTMSNADVALLAGFCSICDWIGSNEEVFQYCSLPLDSTNDLANYFNSRLEQVSKDQCLVRFGLVHAVKPYQGVGALLAADRLPRQVQTLVDELPLSCGLTLVEAPTGSGKTEAALAYAWRLLSAGFAEGVIFALPTQATANAMLARLTILADQLFEDGANVVLAHGKAKYHSGFQRLKEIGCQASLQGDDDIRVQCVEWLAQSRKRVFLGQIGVCTIDQVLLSVLPFKHRFVRGFGLMKSVLIVDEVHAYDAYMYGLLERVLAAQCRGGSSAILLSATLPSSLLGKLAGAWGAKPELDAEAPYPLVTSIQQDGASMSFQLQDPAQQLPERKVQIECLTKQGLLPDETLLTRIIDAVNGGAHVAVVCNLVADAQRVARQLRCMAPTCQVDLFHARYRFYDRAQIEQQVLQIYGPGNRLGGGRVLVATQVIEQSLDLDMDWLITQLCPVDLLFQRLGRLHRHSRSTRPKGFEQPHCTVLVPIDSDYGAHKAIYGNTRVLWRTQQMLQGLDGLPLRFPLAYRPWIERVYQESPWPDESTDMSMAYYCFYGEERAKAMNAMHWCTTSMSEFAESEQAIRVLTRDGEMTRAVLLIDEDGKPLGLDPALDPDEALDLATIGVPNSWQSCLPPADEDGRHRLIVRADGEGWMGSTGEAQFRYDMEFGLEMGRSGDAVQVSPEQSPQEWGT